MQGQERIWENLGEFEKLMWIQICTFKFDQKRWAMTCLDLIKSSPEVKSRDWNINLQSSSKVLGTPGVNLWRNFPLLATTKSLFFRRNVELNMYEVFHQLEHWAGDIKLDSVPTILSKDCSSTVPVLFLGRFQKRCGCHRPCQTTRNINQVK